MASAKPQPLHNFTLPQLKWNKDGHSAAHHHHHRRRSIKSPSRRPPSTSSSSSPLHDSVSSTPPRHHSPLPDRPAVSAAPFLGDDHFGKQKQKHSSANREPSSKKHKVAKHPPIGGDPGRHLARHESGSKSEAVVVKGKSKGGLIEYRRSHSKNLALDGAKNGVQSTIPERGSQKLEAKSKGKEPEAAGIKKKSKILLKIPCKNNSSKTVEEKENPQEEEPPKKKIEKNVGDDQAGGAVQEEGKIISSVDEDTKVWNLRPRKPMKRKSQNANGGGAAKGSGVAVVEKNKAESPLKNPNNKSGENKGNGGGGEKKEKRKLSVFVALSKEEIEEDIYSLTGSKPARRPKKRAKNVQKQVDAVFPGLWLNSITPDSYKVSESSMKG